jgi:hypothetical protein
MRTDAYCLGEKRRVPLLNSQLYYTKSGRCTVRGFCGSCGNTLSMFVKCPEGK